MAKLGEIAVLVRVKISLWDALKLRLSGGGYALKKIIEIEIKDRDNDATERNRELS
jgi:hypothetical protein